MHFAIDLEEEEVQHVMKALTNERDRHRNFNRWSTGEAIQRLVTQMEEQMRKPVASEVAAVGNRAKRA